MWLVVFLFVFLIWFWVGVVVGVLSVVLGRDWWLCDVGVMLAGRSVLILLGGDLRNWVWFYCGVL